MQNEMYIFLDQVKFYARHGVMEQETSVGGVFIVDVKLKVDFKQAMETDDLANTISYADVYEAVKQEMNIPSRLLEHVAGRIVKRLFDDFINVREIELKLSKQNPPMGADLSGAGVILSCKR